MVLYFDVVVLPGPLIVTTAVVADVNTLATPFKPGVKPGTTPGVLVKDGAAAGVVVQEVTVEI